VVSYVIQSDWGNGATISVTITNKSASAVNGWTLAFTFPGNQTITNLWSGTYTQSGASVSVKDAGFNAGIPANGGSTNFGFNLNYSGTNAKPTAFTLNGTACQVQ
jgi:cellulase/cellobiase CelA1